MTVASMLPRDWNRKLVDLNVEKLSDKQIMWADYLFISAMSVQSASVSQIIQRSIALKTKIVAGGPLFTGDPDSYMHVDRILVLM